MMIRDKIIRCTCPVLLIMLALLLGCADKTEAQVTVPNPVSIHDILSTTQVTALKENQQVKDVKIAIRDKLLVETSLIVKTASEIGIHRKLVDFVYDEVGVGGVGKIIDRRAQKQFFVDSTNSEGMAVRIAPSNEELFGE